VNPGHDEVEVEMTKSKVPTQDANRNSENGRFVTERYADRNPKTTEHERIKHPK
jgi:hypothetical protein